MARLTITEHARSDLRAIRAHIAKDNPAAGHRMVERLRAKARRLAETPGMGRSRAEDLRPGLFSFPVGRYVLFYRERHISLEGARPSRPAGSVSKTSANGTVW